jgi:hypothetical protein
MEAEGSGGPRGGRRRGAPYVAAVELTAEETPEPAVAHAPWVRPIGDYERRETTIVEGLRDC